MPIVRMPNGDNVRFPDEMPKEQIRAFISDRFPGVFDNQISKTIKNDVEQAQNNYWTQFKKIDPVTKETPTDYGTGLDYGFLILVLVLVLLFFSPFDKKGIKSILSVSYIKNKGVRRISFVLGLLISLLSFSIWMSQLDNNISYKKYHGIREVQNLYYSNKLTEQQLENIYKSMYPTAIITFHQWKLVFLQKEPELSLANGYYNWCKANDPLLRKWVEQDRYGIYREARAGTDRGPPCALVVWPMEHDIVVKLTNWSYLLWLFGIIFMFYFPFYLSCAIKWIVEGFKKSNKGK
ncbi:MAG: hypothetical protein PHX68_00620 [Alphaproteobacteria bacterium]|nr:hypothetical protein [Alphaproteobacteria bacterium]